MKKAFDKTGKEIHEFDVLKVFHFVGAQRRKHYMYKWVRTYGTGEHKMLYALHLDNADLKSGYALLGKQEGTEIVQTFFDPKADAV